MEFTSQEVKNLFAEQVADFIRKADKIEFDMNSAVNELPPTDGWLNFTPGDRTLTLKAVVVQKVV